VKAIYAGSFDPLTLGHLDLIRRALNVVDELVVAILHNPDKPGFFTPGQRAEMIGEACADAGLRRVTVAVDEGLLADFARKQGCSLLIRGLRNCQDLESESAMARANALLAPGLETIFLVAGSDTAGISSSLIRQIAALGGDTSHFVPANVERALKIVYSKAEQ